MATFLLVHGGWHGGWCWERLTPLLRAAGQRVIAPDLPGHGADRTPIAARPWERYVPSIVALLDAAPEPVVLLGHSSGGMVISAAAAARPERVRTLVYLTAFLLPAGVVPPQVMRDDHESLLPAALIVDEAAGTVRVDPARAREVFYHDCSEADAAWALQRLQPEPIPPRDAAGASPAAPANVPRVYIETLQDRALGPATQRRMYTTLPCERLFSLPTGHSPFISAPAALADCLLALA